VRSTLAASIGIVALAGLALVGCSSGPDASRSTAPALASVAPGFPSTPGSSPGSTGAPGDTSTPGGFRAVVVHVRRPDGGVESYCVWLATTEAERAEGLMSVTSLGGADGMLFRFGGDQSSQFWMKDTVLPLSIAFFDEGGRFVSATDMDPCPAGSSTCPTFGAADPYADALEVEQGRLAALGIGEGASLDVTDQSCSSAT
jgi:uncharacterized membrane protein (UPF0127 family)